MKERISDWTMSGCDELPDCLGFVMAWLMILGAAVLFIPFAAVGHVCAWVREYRKRNYGYGVPLPDEKLPERATGWRWCVELQEWVPTCQPPMFW